MKAFLSNRCASALTALIAVVGGLLLTAVLDVEPSSAGGAGNVPVFNVKEKPYDAAGDGATDDSAEIQAAIDAAEGAGGGLVFLPQGTYKVSTALAMQSSVQLVGAGWQTSKLRLADASNSDIVTATSERDIIIRDLSFDGNKANQTGTPVLGAEIFESMLAGRFVPAQAAIDLLDTDHFEISRSRIQNAEGVGILLDAAARVGTGSSFGVVDGNIIEGSGLEGIYTSGTSRQGSRAGSLHVTISNNHVLDSGESGIGVSQSHYATVTGNSIRNDTLSTNGFGGIRFSNGSSYSTAVGNSIDGTSRGVFVTNDAGVGDRPPLHNTIAANTIRGTALQGVLVQSPHATVVGNTMVDTARSKPGPALQVDDATHCTVSRNVIRDRAGRQHTWGIKVTGASSDHITAVGNVVTGWRKGPVEMLGENSYVGLPAAS